MKTLAAVYVLNIRVPNLTLLKCVLRVIESLARSQCPESFLSATILDTTNLTGSARPKSYFKKANILVLILSSGTVSIKIIALQFFDSEQNMWYLCSSMICSSVWLISIMFPILDYYILMKVMSGAVLLMWLLFDVPIEFFFLSRLSMFTSVQKRCYVTPLRNQILDTRLLLSVSNVPLLKDHKKHHANTM